MIYYCHTQKCIYMYVVTLAIKLLRTLYVSLHHYKLKIIWSCLPVRGPYKCRPTVRILLS